MSDPLVILDTMNLLRWEGSKPVLEIAPVVALARELEAQSLSVLIPIPFHRHRIEGGRFTDLDLFQQELDDGMIRLLKARRGREGQEHDDRWMIATALELDALIISNDGFANHSDRHWACESDFQSWREERVIRFTRRDGMVIIEPKMTPVFGRLTIQEWASYLQEHEHWYETVRLHIRNRLGEGAPSSHSVIRTDQVRDWILEPFGSHPLVVDTVTKAQFLCGLGQHTFQVGYRELLAGVIDVEQSETSEINLVPIQATKN